MYGRTLAGEKNTGGAFEQESADSGELLTPRFIFSGSLLLGNLNFTQGLIFPVFTNADF